jgi:hypothetical protein
MKKINPSIDTFHGINNSLNPCSPQYRQGMAYDAQNSRINESGIWDKAADLAAVSLGDVTTSGLPVSIGYSTDSESGCVSYYKFEETSGTAVDDYFEANDGTASSASIWSADGKIGRCIDCDGQYYIAIPDDATLSFGDGSDDSAFSICCWVYVNSDASGTNTLCARYSVYDSTVEWRITMEASSGLFSFVLCDGSFSNRIVTSNIVAMTLGAWHFVAFTYDGSASEDGLTIYIDGVEVAMSTASSGSYSAMDDTAVDLTIGAKKRDASSDYEWFWDGKIDSFMVFNRELEANVINQLYNNGTGVSDITEGVCPHYKEVTILDTKYVAKNLKYNTSLAVGTNKYGYFAADDMGADRAVYCWDGTDKDSAVGYVDNETEFNYCLAGLGRPTSDLFTEDNAHSGSAALWGGRQERGRYYYHYTWYDTERKVESLPSAVKEWDSDSWSSTYETCEFPFISVKPDAQASAPSTGSPRYDTNTKVRIYRTKRTYTTSKIANPPNEFYFVDSMDYKAGLTGLTYDHTGGSIERKLSGSNGDFTGVAVGDYIYIYDSGDTDDVANQVYQIEAIDSTNAAYVGLTACDGLVDDEGSLKATLMVLPDYLHDNELIEPYEGRGTPPPTDIDFICPFNNRMYYFKKNTVYWSSAGRPEEVAQEYTLTYKLTSAAATTTTSTVTMQPVLSTGSYGEAKYEIAELAGETIMAAYPWRNRLYIWTQEGTCGYLEGTYTTEGVRFYLLRKGIGVISDKTLAHTPYGLFGADREGIWQMDNNGNLFRLSKGWIDIDDSTKSTYAKQSTLIHSFGVWSPKLEEYIWCVTNLGETTVCRQIAYNPLRKIFSGIYLYPALFGGCTVTTSSGIQNYLTNAKTFDDSASETLQQILEFWMGQHSLESVKENIEIEVIYESITASKTVRLGVYQNNIGSKTGAVTFPDDYSDSSYVSHTNSNLVGRVKPTASGRMFLVRIVIPSDCEAPIIGLGYIANHIDWNEKKLR